MDDEQLDELLRNLQRDFNAPPPPPLDDMWATIESAHFDAPRAAVPAARSYAPWLAAAATLLIGVAIGRYVPAGKANPAAPAQSSTSVATTAAPAPDTSAIADAYRQQTTRYLGQAAALLISLPNQSASTKTDAVFAGKAADLLVTTRLLMDSPAAQDPKLRSLLEDLELVLVQIARLRGERNKSDLDLIHQTVEQADVLSRLNSAVVTQSEE
jgi:uncharacterized membrane-anchored protein YhcB (DUF1043 family)